MQPHGGTRSFFLVREEGGGNTGRVDPGQGNPVSHPARFPFSLALPLKK